MTHTGLATAIRAEQTRTDITIAAMATRMRVPIWEASKILYDLRDAGLIDTKTSKQNNLHFYQVTDAGYAAAGVKRPEVWA